MLLFDSLASAIIGLASYVLLLTLLSFIEKMHSDVGTLVAGFIGRWIIFVLAKTNIIHLPINPATRVPTSLCIFSIKLKSVKSNTYDAKPMIALANESNNNIVKRAIIAGKLSFMFLMFLIKIFRLNYRNYVLFKQGYLELNFDNFLMMISLSSAEKY